MKDLPVGLLMTVLISAMVIFVLGSQLLPAVKTSGSSTATTINSAFQ